MKVLHKHVFNYVLICFSIQLSSCLPITSIVDIKKLPVKQSVNSTFQVNKAMIELLKIKKSPELIINDVISEDKSVYAEDKDPQYSIVPSYSGREVILKINGVFKPLKKINYDEAVFTYETPIINQTFSYDDNTPKFRILIDDAHLLYPQSISENEIIVKFNTRSIPDFYLKGLHKLSVINNKFATDTLIKVGQPKEHIDLKPVITSAEIIRNTDNKPAFIKLTGKNFMLYPKFSYCTIDGTFGFGYQTNILSQDESDTWETLIHIPNPNDFEKLEEHIIYYQTPFGDAFISI